MGQFIRIIGTAPCWAAGQRRWLTRTVTVVAITLLLGGCVNVPKQAFNRDLNKDVVAIGLLDPPTITEYPVVNMGHPGLGFGLIGGLVAAADIQAKTDEFTKKIKSRNFDLREECRKLLGTELSQAGYKTTVVTVQREKPGFWQTYETIPAKADAYLDVVCSAGYLSAGPASPYVPTLMLNARMVKRSTSEIIYQEIVSYGYENRFLQAVNISADTQYYFSNFESLTQNDARALEGIRKGLPLVVKRLVQDIRRPELVPAPATTPSAPAAAPNATEATPAQPPTAADATAAPPPNTTNVTPAPVPPQQ